MGVKCKYGFAMVGHAELVVQPAFVLQLLHARQSLPLENVWGKWSGFDMPDIFPIVQSAVSNHLREPDD